MRSFFDTSALLQRYLPEPGRAAVVQWIGQARPALAGPHCRIELYSALNRVRRQSGASDDAYHRTCAELERDFETIEIAPLSPLVEREAVRTLETLGEVGLRGMCALHLASALSMRAELFVTADPRQYRGALVLGLNALLIPGA